MPGWIQVLWRSVVTFFLVLIFVRIMGKKHPSRLTPFGFVIYAVVAVITALISLNIIHNYIFGLIALAVWVLFPIALDYLAIKSKWIHDLLTGKETILIKQGKIMEENLLQARMTGEELLRELRSKNAFNLTDVEFAVMESTGEINVLLKSDKKPVTSYDLGKKVAPRTEPQTVILDGSILDEPLANLGLTRAWLQTQLAKLGVSLNNVFLGQVDSYGDLYVDLFDDAVQLPQPKDKEIIYANLEKVEADLRNYVLETEDQNAKEMYSRNAEKIKTLMKKLKPYLLR